MKFDSLIHTKPFLLSNKDTLKSLCEHSAEFAMSQLASDKEILNTAFWSDDSSSFSEECRFTTVAHTLARFNPHWASTAGAQDPDILRIADSEELFVAHELACHQPGWGLTPIAKNTDVLNYVSVLVSVGDSSVASVLADYNPQWVASLTVDDMDILTLRSAPFSYETIAERILKKQPDSVNDELLQLKSFLEIKTTKNSMVNNSPAKRRGYLAHIVAERVDRWRQFECAKSADVLRMMRSDGFSVAHILASKPDWVAYSADAYKKEVLTIAGRKGSVAEHLCGLGADEIILRVVRTGAAFKVSPHSGSADVKATIFDSDLREAFKRALTGVMTLIEDEADALIKMKIALAYYSTLQHFQTVRFNYTIDQWHADNAATCQTQIALFEAYMEQLLREYPDIMARAYSLRDINTEPGMEFMSKLTAFVALDCLADNRTDYAEPGAANLTPLY